MKILFVASRFPYPPIQGDRARAYHHLRVLSQKHEIVLITPPPVGDREDGLKIIGALCEQSHLVSRPLWRRGLRLIQAPFSKKPLQTLYLFDPKISQKAKKLLEREPFDLIHVQLVRMAPVVENLGKIPKVLDFIDALSLNIYRRSMRENGPVAWFMALESKRLEDYERYLTQKYDQLVVSSPLDCDAIGNYDNIHVIPNGVSIEDFPFVADGREPKMIVFTGRMGYFPNADAVIWFVEKVLPLIQQQLSEVKFYVVGADPTSEVQVLAQQPGVFVTGYVSSIQDYLHQATVAVAPLQSGSGMQFKVIEAMGCGTPVVATSYALGGVDVLGGEHLLVANNAESFAQKVICLLRDEDLQRYLAHNARRLVEEKYTWDRSVTMLEDVYHLAVQR